MSLHVGQRVICIKIGKWLHEDWGLLRGNIYPRYGQTFTIREICREAEGTFLRFLEIHNPPTWYSDEEVGFHCARFRPFIERKTSFAIFTAMLTPSPTKREPVA